MCNKGGVDTMKMAYDKEGKECVKRTIWGDGKYNDQGYDGKGPQKRE